MKSMKNEVLKSQSCGEAASSEAVFAGLGAEASAAVSPLWTETPFHGATLYGSTALMQEAIGAAMKTAVALMGSRHAYSPEYVGMACAQDAISVIDKALLPQKRGPAAGPADPQPEPREDPSHDQTDAS